MPLFIFILLGTSGGFAHDQKETTSLKWLVDEPEQCLNQKKYPCAIRALSTGTLHWEGVSFRIHKSSSLLFSGEHQFRLLQGVVGVQSPEESVTLREATLILQARGDVWFEKPLQKQILIRNLNGDVKLSLLHPMESSTEQVIPPGYENWYSGMESHGNILQGTLRPLDPKKFLHSWNQLYRWPKSEAQEKLEVYKKLWGPAPVQIAELYSVSAQRMVASLEAEKLREQERESSRKAERAKILKMYKDRYENGSLP